MRQVRLLRASRALAKKGKEPEEAMRGSEVANCYYSIIPILLFIFFTIQIFKNCLPYVIYKNVGRKMQRYE